MNPQSPYAASKVAADQLSISFYKSFGLPVTILRPFNTYGPRQSARAIIPSLVTQIMSGKKNIKIGNIKTSRDFTFIDDTISALTKAIDAKNIKGETINISSNNQIFIMDIIREIKHITNKNFRIQIDKKRLRPKNSEVNILVGDNTKAKKLLNWKVSNSNSFKSGLKNN